MHGSPEDQHRSREQVLRIRGALLHQKERFMGAVVKTEAEGLCSESYD